MLKRVAVAVLLVLGFAQAVAAKTVFTCSGGTLFIDVPLSDGSWVCYQTTSSCSGEWSFEVGFRANIPDKPGFTHTKNVSARRAAEVLRLATGLEQKGVHLFYRASDSIQKSFWRRAGLSPKGTVGISEKKLAPWLLAGMSSGNLSSGPVGAPGCPDGLYPNPQPGGGTNCYPCLGCTPCPPPGQYCGLYRVTLKPSDLSAELATQGYTLRKGKIVPPKKKE
jgi:hypothetical protein